MEWWVAIVLVMAILLILFPVAYVWNVNIIGAIYTAVKRTGEKGAVWAKWAAFVALFFLVVLLFPVLIWVALAVVIRKLSLRWRELRLPSSLVCGVDADCPPRYVCVNGRCVPQY